MTQFITGVKEAGLRDLWQKVKDTFSGDATARRRVEYHFSPKAGLEKWDRFPRNVRNKTFLNAVKNHPEADDKLKLHAQSMHDLSRAKTVGKIESSGGRGKNYEIKQLPGGRLGCTCNDWRYKGSVTPSHDCKHIRAFKAGGMKVASFNTETAAFFDELTKITEEKERKHSDEHEHFSGPFSTLLTQEEEPGPYHPKAPPPDDPDIIRRWRIQQGY